MKYFVVEINEKTNNSDYLEMKKKKALGAIFKLKSCFILNNVIKPRTSYVWKDFKAVLS